ncbi:MAG: hypothetical protein M3256_08440 [Actinomycetota bacterium]|nr:hypothetical protein [Actinomycetota bacterium]
MPVVRVLIVTNDWIGVVNGGFLQWTDQPSPQKWDDKLSRQFYLGEFVDVLEKTAWVGFTVELTKAHRGTPTSPADATQFVNDRGADVIGFRFDKAFEPHGQTRHLADYDLVLFFPISPESDTDDDGAHKEAEAVAKFMRGGGGFFATGDHEDLGAPVAQFIPRVRSMRRWAVNGGGGAPVAPSSTGADRHDTTRPGPDGIVQFEDQSDEIAQIIEPTWYGGGFGVKSGYPATVKYPHPLLCSPDGPVRHLPDHMHEGWCEVPDNLAGRTFAVGGTSFREYPDGPDGRPLSPEVVATGTVDGGHPTPVIDSAHHSEATADTTSTTFGVIGAWDGHRVGEGRVVVDSTWHHFFNINLTGDLFLRPDGLVAPNDQRNFGFFVYDPVSKTRIPNDDFQEIMWYFRNLVYWLIPAARMEEVWWHSLVQLTRRPQLSEELRTFHKVSDVRRYTFNHFYYLGQLAERYLQNARGGCAVYNIHIYLYLSKIPPWEWVEDLVDIWNPAVKQQDEGLSRMRLAGVLGAGPALEVLLRTILGSAVLAAAQVRADVRAGPEDGLPEHLVPTFHTILRHGLDQLTAELQVGRRALDLILETAALPVRGLEGGDQGPGH